MCFIFYDFLSFAFRDEKKKLDGKSETHTCFERRIPKLISDGNKDGESPNKKSGDEDTPGPRTRYILIYKNNTKHIFIV